MSAAIALLPAPPTRAFLALTNVDLAAHGRRNAIVLGALRERARIFGLTFDWTYAGIIAEGVRGKYQRSSVAKALSELAADGSIAKKSDGRVLSITLRCPKAGPQKSRNQTVVINNAHARQTQERATRKKQNTPTRSDTETKTPEPTKTQGESQKQTPATIPADDARQAAALLKTCPGFNHAYAFSLARIYPPARIADAFAAWHGGTWDDPPAALSDAVVKGWRPSKRQRAVMPRLRGFPPSADRQLSAELRDDFSQRPAPPKAAATEWKRPDDWRREKPTEVERVEMVDLAAAIHRAAAVRSMPGPRQAGGKNRDVVHATRAAKPQPSADDFGDWQRRCEVAGRLVPVCE